MSRRPTNRPRTKERLLSATGDAGGLVAALHEHADQRSVRVHLTPAGTPMTTTSPAQLRAAASVLAAAADWLTGTEQQPTGGQLSLPGIG